MVADKAPFAGSAMSGELGALLSEGILVAHNAVFDKAILLYFSFLIIGVVGFVNSYVNRTTFYVLVSMSLLILVVGLIPYIITMLREEKRLNQLINSHARKREGGKR